MCYMFCHVYLSVILGFVVAGLICRVLHMMVFGQAHRFRLVWVEVSGIGNFYFQWLFQS